MSTKKSSFRNIVQSYAQTFLNCGIGELDDHLKSSVFGRCFLLEIQNKLIPGRFPEEFMELESFVTDGPNDNNVDFVFSDGDEHYFIQFKYRTTKKSESDADVRDFTLCADRLHPISGRNYKKNSNLTEATSNIDWANDKFYFWYVSLGQATEDIRTIEHEGIKDSSAHRDLQDLSTRSEFRFWDEKDLDKDLRAAQSTGAGLKDVEVNMTADSAGVPFYTFESDQGLRSFIGVIQISEIYRLFQDANFALFNLNIRNFVGDTSTNKGLMESAQGDPDSFFFFNNGISAICESVSAQSDGKTLHCKNFSVINGAQTFKSLHKVYGRYSGLDKTEISKVKVMIRITEVDSIYKNTEFVDSITRYNNTQNAVQISDFRSNDAIQTGLHQKFKNITYQGKYFNYLNKRGMDRNTKHTHPIKLDDFCKIIYSFQRGPIDCFGGKQHLYDSKPTGGYFFLFGDAETNAILDHLPDELFEKVADIYLVSVFSREIFTEFKKTQIAREEKQIDDARQNGEAPRTAIVGRALQGLYLIVFATAVVLQELALVKNLESKYELLRKLKISKPDIWQKDTNISGALKNAVTLACDLIIKDYTQQYQNNKSFVHRNYFREQATLERLKVSIKGEQTMLEMIADKLQ